MDLSENERTRTYRVELMDFMQDSVYPAEAVLSKQMSEAEDRWHHPEIIEDLKAEARERGLWNLFLPDEKWGSGLSNLEYAPLAEIMGMSPMLAPEATNCSAPDTGNMEILVQYGSSRQQEEWLKPLLEGEVRSCFSMTEPDVASSDASNISTTIERQGDDYVITGRKWWSSGAMSSRCELAVVMGVTDADGPTRGRHTMVLVPLDAPGVEIERFTTVFGYDEGVHGGHAQISYHNVRVPVANRLGEEGQGFAVAQARLGPGRIHHCMRAIGMAERALRLLCERAASRVTFGKRIIDQGVIQDWIAEARIRINQARLLVLETAAMIDHDGLDSARTNVAAIKVAAPRVARWVIDRAIQVHGGAGVSQDTPLASLYATTRILQIADGPDEVHKMSIARREARNQLGDDVRLG